jgi:hypothetical protein
VRENVCFSSERPCPPLRAIDLEMQVVADLHMAPSCGQTPTRRSSGVGANDRPVGPDAAPTTHRCAVVRSRHCVTATSPGALGSSGSLCSPKPLRRYAAVVGPCLTPFGVWHFPRGARGRHTWLTRWVVGATSSPDAREAGDIFPHPFVAGQGVPPQAARLYSARGCCPGCCVDGALRPEAWIWYARRHESTGATQSY